MRQLTVKQNKVADFVLDGKDAISSIMEVYDCKNKAVAYQINHKLQHNKLFLAKINEYQEIANKTLQKEAGKFVDILEERLPRNEVIDKLVELINSDDKRVIMQAIQEYNKVMGNYADKKLGIYRDLEKEQKDLYITEAEVYDNKRPETTEGDTVESV